MLAAVCVLRYGSEIREEILTLSSKGRMSLPEGGSNLVNARLGVLLWVLPDIGEYTTKVSNGRISRGGMAEIHSPIMQVYEFSESEQQIYWML